MNSPMSAPQILEREFLEIRAKLLELAAALDRLDRAEGSVRDDPRIQSIQRSIEVLARDKDERAEQIQLVFSLPYESDWRTQFELARR